MEHWIGQLLSHLGSWAYVVIGLSVGLECAGLLGLVFPGETLAILGGFFAARGSLSLWIVLPVVVGSAIIGDNIGFEMGRRLGRDWLVKAGRHVRLKEPDIKRVEDLFHRHGGAAVAIGRFLTFGRAIVPYVAGISKVRYRVFMPYNALGGALWGAAAVFVGYGFAAVWDKASHWVTGVTIGTGVAVVVGTILWFRKRKGRGGKRKQGVRQQRTAR